jgi:hypothetical protein
VAAHESNDLTGMRWHENSGVSGVQCFDRIHHSLPEDRSDEMRRVRRFGRMKLAVGFLFSAGSFIINEHLLKRFRVEERHGSDLLEFDFAPPH